MSGHSKWASIKRQKGATDAKRGALFTKLGKAIVIAAREGGGDPTTNFKLRLAVDRAKQSNMPKDNIERSIKRGTGELAGDAIEEITYEAFGPGGSALVIESLTDNKNRSLPEIKNILKKYGGSLASANSVLWMFERKGVITLPLPSNEKREETEIKIIEAEASDFKEEDSKLIIYTAPNQLHQVMDKLKESELAIEESSLEMIAKETIKLEGEQEEKLEKLMTELDDNAEVNNVYLNVE